MTISNEQLRATFLSPQMLGYFRAKLFDLSPDELLRRIEETLKFLNIATYMTGDIPVTKEIDDVWHLWILETKEYQKLCGSLQGRQFLHHSSNAYQEAGTAGEDRHSQLDQDVAVLATYVHNYGYFEPDRVPYWVLPRYLVQMVGWTVEQLNDWLSGATEGATAATVGPGVK